MTAQNTEGILDAQAIKLKGPAECISRLYFLLARCFSYPKEGLCESMRDKKMEDAIRGFEEGLPFGMDSKNIPPPALSQDELENLYISTFDMGMERFLYESAYEASGDVYQELLRFYEHFDVKLSEKERDYPDNLAVELEFMAFLAKKESGALDLGKEPNPYRHAQSDFLERHLNKWVHKLNERIQKNLKEPFYKGASAFMVEFLRNHQLYLQEALKG